MRVLTDFVLNCPITTENYINKTERSGRLNTDEIVMLKMARITTMEMNYKSYPEIERPGYG